MADNFFTRKSLGGVPNGVWLAGGVLGLYVLRSKSSSGSSSGSSQQQQQAQQQQALAAQLAEQEQMLAGYGAGSSQGSQIYLLGNDGSGTPPASTPAQTATGTASTGTTTAAGPSTSITYLNQQSGEPTTFSAPPQPGYGYTYSPTTGQWGETPGTGIGYEKT
jgi:hypothetical protein